MTRHISLLSIVIPCYNEQEILPLSYDRLTNVLQNLVKERKCSSYEILFVDDGSTDETLSTLERIFEKDGHVVIISLRRNFGLQGALCAGLVHARGDAVVTIDADLQDPPEKIAEMISFYKRDYDLVLGVRKDRSCDSFTKRFLAQSFYRFIKFLKVELVYNHGDFRLMARELVNEFNNLPERNRFIRATVLKLDSRYAIVEYAREPRKAGDPKFSFKSSFALSLDGITSFTFTPLRLAFFVGLGMWFISILGIIWVFYTKMNGKSIPGWTSTLLPLLVFSGVQIFFLGLIGEYVGRLYIETKQRPLFIVRKKYDRK